MGHNIFHGELMDLLDPFEVQPPAVALIGRRRIGIPVAKDRFSLPKGGQNDPAEVLNPVGGV
jgi:hypothetical protein